jgi:rod shape-determining protein MreD
LTLKTFITLLLVGLCALMLEGALATIFPPPWCPDLAFLVVVSVGLCRRGLIPGLLFAYLLGSSIDVLSGSLMGLHALLSIFAFMAAAFAGSQLNLKSTFSLMGFVASLSVVYGLSLYLLSSFFSEGIDLGLVWIIETFVHAAINALAAPFVVDGISRLVAWSGTDDSQERALYLESVGKPL